MRLFKKNCKKTILRFAKPYIFVAGSFKTKNQQKCGLNRAQTISFAKLK